MLVLAAGCRKPGTAAAGGPGGAKGTPAGMMGATATTVSVTAASTGDISKTVDLTGNLVALQDVVVGAKTAGRVVAVYPHEGDLVRAGQTVAVMDAVDMQAGVQQAQANLQAAITKEQQAQAAYAQAVNALQNARTNRNWYDQTTRTAVATAKSALESAKQNLSIVKQGARAQERQQAQEQVSAAKANFDKAKSDLKRYQDLYREQAVSQSQLDEKQAAYDTAQANYNSAQQALSLIREGARPEDIRRAELAVQQSQDALNKAQADRAQVHMRDEDIQNAQAGIDVAKANIKSAQAGTAQARASLRIAQEALSNAYVKSPIDGYVAERRAEPGQQVGGGGAILRIVNPATVYFQGTLSESQYAEVRLNQPASVTIDALGARKFQGRVSRILPVASTAARSFLVNITVPTDTRMRPQMFARGSILVDTHRSTTLVPKDAVLFDTTSGKGARVFVAEGGKAQERSITVGYMTPQQVEVTSGVKPGDKVITAGQTALQNGDPIRIQGQQAAGL